MEAHDDGSRIGGDWSALKLKARFLLIAALAVGIVLATPAIAQSPNFYEMALISRTPAIAKMYAQTQLNIYGWDAKTQWPALERLWTLESNWRPNAKNHQTVKMLVNGKWVKFYAGGIPQRLGLNPKTSVPFQVNAGLKYIKARYGSPVKALNFWDRHYWY